MSKKRKAFKASLRVKARISEGIDANALRNPRQATRLSKEALKKGKKNLKLRRKQYQKLKAEQGLQVIVAKKKYVEAKAERAVSKAVFKAAKKSDPTRVSYKAKRYAKQEVKQTAVHHLLLAPIEKEETLKEGIDLYRKGQRAKTGLKLSKDVVTSSVKASVNLSKHTYGLTQRSFNMVRGRGFVRTPEDLKWRKQMAKKIRNAHHRLRQVKRTKQAELGWGLIRSLLQGKQTLRRALSLIVTSKGLVLLLMVLLVLMLLNVLNLASSVPVKQDDFQLTKSWTYLTKLDAEHSEQGNSFYTPLDDVMFYMNDQFEDYDLKDSVTLGNNSATLPNQNYEQYLTGLWTALNGSPPDYKITTMKTLETTQSSKYFLSPEAYSELKEKVEEVGYTSLDGQLQFPYPTDALVVYRRYGYERQGKQITLHPSLEVSVTQGQDLTAPMDGKVNAVTDSDTLVISEAEKARLTLKGVASGRFIGGETVKAGTFLGKASKSSLHITYEKYNEAKKVWEKVNPAFYFPKVTYTQLTALASDHFEPGKNVSERAEAVYHFLTKLGYKKEGICAILGNWSEESAINPKRAEGDYLNPPAGASGNCWDDPNWLAMGNQEIYQGKYPNIVHRGLGLGQWTDTADGSHRHTMLLDYAKAKNKKWYDLNLQLDFMVNGDTPGNQTMFKNTASNAVSSSIPELTNYFLVYWEGNPGDKVQARVQAAQNWFTYFSNNGGSDADMSASSKALFEKYKDKIHPLPTNKETQAGQGWPGNGYAPGNCTWYVFNRQAQLEHAINGYMGNGGEWGRNYFKTPGATIDAQPQVGDAVSFSPGVAGSSSLYGHVAQVEVVNPDGTFLVSEMNTLGLYSMGYRMFRPGAGMTFIHFK
ncbi:phage tail tip lysozyme [Lactococcus lactis]|uniref:Surface antigen n=1 Tax=Lactococcus lactis TaxID=1358 RepID=A0AAW5TRQ2_9LACT|nr:phage tail tip lysozyme [Lactococcus lactis]MCW2281206.1 surface antigen [Lactococcus lactis]